MNIVIPGLATEELAGLTKAFVSSRLMATYVPSLYEWLLTAGIVGLGLLLFGIGEKLLPAETATAEAEEHDHVIDHVVETEPLH